MPPTSATGVEEDGEFEAGEILNLSTQAHIQFREATGRPAWAGGGSQGSSEAGQNAVPYAETEDHQWMTLEGTVVSVDVDQMVVETSEGQLIITDRPWSFAQEQGFTAQVGDQISLVGFYEEGTFEVGQLINENSSQATTIREESGRPLWAGGRGGGGRGGPSF